MASTCGGSLRKKKFKMKILLFGNSGQLGWELERSLLTLGEVIPLDYPAVNLLDEASTRAAIRTAAPHVIVNATGYTAVDKAESEPDRCAAINARAPAVMAEEARSLGAALIHYSTDYVFDGLKGSPYVETDAPSPLSVYARTKLEGEQAVQQVGGAFLILRLSWMYSLRRDSFVTKVLSWSRKQRTLRLVTDQIGNPVWARTVAEATAQLLALGIGRPSSADVVPWLAEHSGIYHFVGPDHASRFEFAQAILRLDPQRDQQLTEQVLPALTSEFPTPAARPLLSALDNHKLIQTFGLQLPLWERALRLAMTVDTTGTV
jgi:dTDP-4-dehydrorhamnose reductase